MQLKYNEIHVIGDSHNKALDVNFFYCQNYYYSYTPMTMYEVSKRKNFYKLGFDAENLIPKNGLWIFCFGEIDVRCLIYNQIHEKKRQEDEVINTLVDNYIDNCLSAYSEIGIVSVVPPSRYYKEQTDIYFPFIGPDEDRSRYTCKINSRLKKKCEEKNLLYINIYDAYKDAEGFLPKEYSDGDVHIKDKSKIKSILEKIEFQW
jgi:hypothetical protein